MSTILKKKNSFRLLVAASFNQNKIKLLEIFFTVRVCISVSLTPPPKLTLEESANQVLPFEAFRN